MIDDFLGRAREIIAQAHLDICMNNTDWGVEDIRRTVAYSLKRIPEYASRRNQALDLALCFPPTTDLLPTPMSNRVSIHHNNCYGAVLSALYAFWSSRRVATRQGAPSGARNDSYSIVLFDHTSEVCSYRL